MPKTCSAHGCLNHHMMKDKKVSFFCLPNLLKKAERRRLWVRACQRINSDGTQWIPHSKYVYICSEHFVTGKPVDDPDHIDYVPTVFKTTSQMASHPKKRKKLPDSYRSIKKFHHNMEAAYEAAEALITLAKTQNTQTSLNSASDNTTPVNSIENLPSNTSNFSDSK